jgi:GNAT superfamily N-acetyltransferase
MSDPVPGREFDARELDLRDGRRVTVRLACPADAAGIQAAIRALAPESRRSRFMSALAELTPAMLEHVINPDARHECQIVAATGGNDGATIVGGARYGAAPGSTDCEFAVAIADDWQGAGLARRLLEFLIDEARTRGFTRMEGYVFASNRPMLALAHKLGFSASDDPDDRAVRIVRRELA